LIFKIKKKTKSKVFSFCKKKYLEIIDTITIINYSNENVPGEIRLEQRSWWDESRGY